VKRCASDRVVHQTGSTLIRSTAQLNKTLHWLPALAPSPRILAYLARKAQLTQPCMALVAVPVPEPPAAQEPEVFAPPPAVATTPCEPWPRPYYFEDGLRKVRPYHYTYNTYCKERWRGRGLLDVFTAEFRDRPALYYVRNLPVDWS
jgi:tRNA pseudouridine32 synthase